MAQTFTNQLVVYDPTTGRYIKAAAADTVAQKFLQAGDGSGGSLVINTAGGNDLTILEDSLTRAGDIAINPGAANVVTTDGSLDVGVDLNVTGDASIGGNLTVAGDIISGGTQNVVIADSFLDLNSGNTLNSGPTAKAGGFTVQFSKSVGFGTPVDVIEFFSTGATTGGGAYIEVAPGDETNFAAGDIIAVSGATDPVSDDNGLFAVLNVTTSGQIAIVATANAQAPFLQTALSSGVSGAQALVYGVSVGAFALSNGILASGAGAIALGTPCYASGETTSDFNNNWTDMASVSVSLQSAYAGGNTIAMTTAAGSIDITTTGGQSAAFNVQTRGANSTIESIAADLTLQTSTSGDLSLISAADAYLTAAAGKFEVTGGANSLVSVASANLTLSTTTSGAIAVSSAGLLDIDAASALSLNSSGGAINIGDDAVAQNINIGTGAQARTLTIGNATSTTQVVVNTGTAGLDVNALGVVTISAVGNSDFAVTSGNLALSTATSGSITADGRDGVSINSTNGALGLGDASNTGAVNVGTAGARSISIGSASATAVNLEADAGSINLKSNANFEAAGVVTAAIAAGVAAGDAVYWDGSQYAKSDADSGTSAAQDVDGIAIDAGGGTGRVATVDGTTVQCTFTSAPTAGQIAYLSTTAGALVNAAPTAAGARVFKVGRVVSTGGGNYLVRLQKQYIIDIAP